MPTGHLVHLDSVVDDLWQTVIAPSTRRVYSTGFKAFQTFLALSGFPGTNLYPVSEDILIYFLAHCYKVLNLQHSTITTYFAGVRFNYLCQGVGNPLTTPVGLPLYRLQMLLKAVKKLRSKPTVLRFPIDADVLKNMSISLNSGIFGPFTDIMMKAACTLAFFGFLRCGEFTAASSVFDPSVHLTIADVIFEHEVSKFTLNLKRSKVDIFRQGVHIPFYKTNSEICPVTTMHEYLSIRKKCGGTCSAPLFITSDGSVLTRARFIHMLRDVLYRLGYNQAAFCGHSFRIGAATAASKANIQDHLIKCLGRWSSECYVRYIRTPECAIRDAQRALSISGSFT